MRYWWRGPTVCYLRAWIFEEPGKLCPKDLRRGTEGRRVYISQTQWLGKEWIHLPLPFLGGRGLLHWKMSPHIEEGHLFAQSTNTDAALSQEHLWLYRHPVVSLVQCICHLVVMWAEEREERAGQGTQRKWVESRCQQWYRWKENSFIECLSSICLGLLWMLLVWQQSHC